MNRVAFVEIEEGHELACSYAPDMTVHVGDQCIVEGHSKILEFGKVTKVDEASNLPAEKRNSRIVRRATLQDLAKANEDVIMGRIAMTSFNGKVKKMGLDMRVVRGRYSFGRAVLKVTFTSEERLDYSALVQELSAELRTRIEMNQIGVRDEAGLIGGMGPCGRRLCCCSWLHHFDSVNVRMAKAQRVSLNPGAISGMCGRLKCCLRYEFDTYRELGRNMPHDGAEVEGPDGKGMVLDKNILRQSVRVRLKDDRIVEYNVDELRVDKHTNKPRRDDDEDPGAEWAESEPAGKAGTRHLRPDEPG